MDAFRAANLANWEERARLHATDATGSYRIAEALSGRSVLHAIEAAEIGDVSGLRVAHLQCHIGLDTLSLAHLGAQATGLDFSGASLAAARGFAARAGRDVRFVEADVYDAAHALDGEFDRVFVTWGAINWLPDIGRWAQVVASLLRPGGRLYLAETHPYALVFDERDGRIVPAFDWRTPAARPLVFDEATTYTGDARRVEAARTYEWIHPLCDVLSAVAAAGLALDWLHEHEALPYRLFPRMAPDGRPGLFRLPDGDVRMPLSFSLQATRRR